MKEYKHREVDTVSFMGEHVDFVVGNDRLRERVQNVSHERHVLQALIELTNPDDVVWDVGACLGIHSFTLAKHLPDGHVVGFEPMPTNRGVLLDNKAVNELSNVYISRAALADEAGTAEFAIRQSMQAGYGRHSLTTGEDKYEKVRTIDVDVATGDGLVVRGERPPNIVKIDAEGAGPLVLEGMREVLASDACRAVVMETHEPNPVQPSHEDFGYSREDILEIFADLGYEVETLGADYHLLATKDAPERPAITDAVLDIGIVQGDIAEESADALVNSAGTSMRMGTGVAGALRAAGGEGLNLAAIDQYPVEVGSAVVTEAFALDAEYVIHAVSMPHYGDGRSTPESVRFAVSDALDTADDLGCESIVIPAVGCGLGGLSLATGADIILSLLAEFEPEHLQEARVIAYTEDELQTIRSVAGLAD